MRFLCLIKNKRGGYTTIVDGKLYERVQDVRVEFDPSTLSFKATITHGYGDKPEITTFHPNRVEIK